MAGQFVQWVVRHGVLRAVIRLGAWTGEPQAKLAASAKARENPYPVYDRVREQGPIYKGKLTWQTASHEGVAGVLRHPGFRVGLGGADMPKVLRAAVTRQHGAGRIVGPIDPPSLLAVNPPEHTRYRKLVQKVFTPRAVSALEGHVRGVADDLLDDLERQARNDGTDTVDIVSAYAALLPVTVIAEVLGVPMSSRDDLLTWGHAASPALDFGLSYREFVECEAGVVAFNEWMYAHIANLRRHPGDDLLSRLVTLEENGERLTDLELVATAGLLLAAGFETTVNLLGSGVDLLLRNPGQLALLREAPEHWDTAVDEVLRYEAPVQFTARFSTEALEVCGVPVPARSLVRCLIGAANRDPAVFDRPHEFDVTRANAKEHLSFSGGVHYCLGASLARLEGRVGLQALLERFPELAAAGTPVRRPTRNLRGWAHLPVRLGPRAAVRGVPTPG